MTSVVPNIKELVQKAIDDLNAHYDSLPEGVSSEVSAEASNLRREMHEIDEKISEYDAAMQLLDELKIPRTDFPGDPRGLARDPESRDGLMAYLSLSGRIRRLAKG
jgi:hypothetical protein